MSFSPDIVPRFITTTGVSLFLEILSKSNLSEGTGLFISPLSVYCALALAFNGAGFDSTTHSDLEQFLTNNFSLSSRQLQESTFNDKLKSFLNDLSPGISDGSANGNGSAEFSLANSIWSRGIEIKADYAESMKAVLNATAKEAVGGAADVNAWVSEVTKGKITELLGGNNFNAVLANALYFKGFWKSAFQTSHTSKQPFTTASGAVKQVDMMEKTFESRDELHGLELPGHFSAVILPYKGASFAAAAVLPAEGVSIAEAARGFFDKIKETRSLGKRRVLLPKFKAESSMSLLQPLQDLGLRTALGPTADFSRISASPLTIGDVVHKTLVEVDEEGTVAAAATGIIMLTAMPLPPPEIIFNRPFIFSILHVSSHTPVFLGVVSDPTASG